MLTGKELGAAIESARIAKGVSKKKLAEDFGVKPPSVQGWVNTGRIDKAKLMELIAYFSDTVGLEHWGITERVSGAIISARPGEPLLNLPEDAVSAPQEAGPSEGDQRHASTHSNVAPTLQPHREAKEYPLISWVAAGSWAESCVIPHRSAADEWLESSENAGLYGYWLEVKGRSMVDPSGQAAASFPPGMRILVQPEGFDVVSGKLYIARLRAPGGSWETTFKQYVRDAGVEYLQPLNPDFETLKIDENVEIIGRVIDARPPRSVF